MSRISEYVYETMYNEDSKNLILKLMKTRDGKLKCKRLNYNKCDNNY